MKNNTDQWINWDDITPDTSVNMDPTQPQTTEPLNWEEPQNNIPVDQELTWGEPEPHPSEHLNWNEPDKAIFPETTSENSTESFSEDNQLNLPNINNEMALNRSYSRLGSINKIQINTDLYTLNFDTNELINELSFLNPIKLDEKGRYEVDFSQSQKLTDVILTLQQIASTYNTKLKSCFVYRITPGDKLLNIFKGKPSNSFIYYLQADYNSSHVINDLSSIGGPSVSQTDPASGILNVFPGWVPYSLSENNSEGEMIALAGTFA